MRKLKKVELPERNLSDSPRRRDSYRSKLKTDPSQRRMGHDQITVTTMAKLPDDQHSNSNVSQTMINHKRTSPSGETSLGVFGHQSPK